MRMVSDAGFVDDFDRAFEFKVSLFDDGGVFRNRNDLVIVADDVEEGNPGLGEGSKLVDRIAFVAFRFFGGELVGGGDGLIDFWPAFKISDWSIGVDTGNFFGILCRPVEDNQAAA